MQGVTELIENVKIPQMVEVRQKYDAACISEADVTHVICEQLIISGLASRILPGMRVAITCGSRGIHYYDKMVKYLVEFVKDRGAEPFIVAAMGSHGGATSEGQCQILTDYHITPAEMGCPVLCDMDTVDVGKSLKRHYPVYVDKNAATADGILLFNRIKPHTSFTGKFESGLMKMMAIGLGKQKGADAIHGQSPAIMHELVEEYGKTIISKCPILGGVAVIENAYDLPCKIVGVTAEKIEEVEPSLLKEAYKKMPLLMFEQCDVLIVDRIGKNISGDGMDPNVTGRFCTKYRSGGINAEKIVVLDLTPETHGNAQGIGLADVTTRRLFNKMKLEMTYPTGVTNTFLRLMKIPMIMDNDREAIQLALHSCPEAEDRDNLKVIRIHDTAHIETLEISTGLLNAAKQRPDIKILTKPYDLIFDKCGNLF